MKSYKKSLPIILTLALVLSALFCIYSKSGTQSEYDMLLSKARDYAERGITYDAIENYVAALEIEPSIDITLEAGELYLRDGDVSESELWYKSMLLKVYPKDPRTFLYGIRSYKLDENYKYAYKVYADYQGRGLYAEEVELEMDPIRYTYRLSGSYGDARPFSNINNYAAVCYHDRWGYIDASGNRVIDYKYEKADAYGDYAAVIDQNGRAYFIDGEGYVRINDTFIRDTDPDFGPVVEFQGIQSDMLLAYNGTVWNFYDAATYEKLFGGYADARGITNGVGAVSKDGVKWALIDETGAEITGYVFDEVVADGKGIVCRTEAIVVRQGDRYYLVDRSGERLTEGYDRACAFYDVSGAAFAKGNTWYFLDETGEVVCTGTFEDARSFSNGFAAVKIDGLWGYIDESGELLIPAEFDEAGPFNMTGCAFVLSDENWTLLRLYKYNY